MRPYRPIKKQLRKRLEAFSSRIPYLPKHEYQLIRIFLSGCTFSQIAVMANVLPATVARRIAKIVSRLSGTNYMCALRFNKEFNFEQMDILRAHFVEGLSVAEMSRQSGKSRAYITKTIVQLEMIVKEEDIKQKKAEEAKLKSNSQENL
ncbi:MAG: hypothetical protein K8R02_03110 [Anaerohalosphaeraceae bacterium]|nr:hypothetical protein [Anaerohalosphaeraceae bacterium]